MTCILSNVFTMENQEKLTAEEVICLQMNGVSTMDILHTHPEKIQQLLEEKFLYRPSLSRAKLLLSRQESLGIATLTVYDEDFPKRLLAIGNDCPAVIYCLGNMGLLKRERAVGIIGARACDQDGYDMAYNLASKYAQEGNVIVSGLALGCDTAAHRGCLNAKGETIAVVATGLNRVHLKQNKIPQEVILANNGLTSSEMPLDEKATPCKLVMRNRIQAALSEKMILVQCPAKSGSMYTMEFAKLYGKECLAATYLHRSEINEGNYILIDNGEAKPI